MRRVLVTGGAGFIGSRFVRRMLSRSRPTSVINLDSLSFAGRRTTVDELEEMDGHQFVHGDIRDEPLVDSLMSSADVVVNFAAESHVDRSIALPSDFLSANVVGVGVLLDAARRHNVERFIHVSTDEVYGSIDTGSFTEADPLNPSSPYAASKASADLVVAAYRHTYGYEAIVTRCTNNYGPYQHPEKLIPMAITRLMGGVAVPLYGDGRQERDWLWVDDHCAAIELLIDEGEPGEIYNVSADAPLSNVDVVDRLIDLVGSGSVEHVEDRPGHDRRYALDSSKLRSLGWQPGTGIDQGLAMTVDWYRKRTEWWRSRQGTA